MHAGSITAPADDHPLHPTGIAHHLAGVAAAFRAGRHRPPAAVTFAGNSSSEESWNYSGAYDDTVAFLRKQFATRRKYDANGATSWRDLPPCYNDTYENPSGGWVMENSTLWVWADANNSLFVQVFRPDTSATPNEIVIDYMHRDDSLVCNRQ